MTDEEKWRAKMCANNIKDKIESIWQEVYFNDNPYKGYILEKAKPILNDIQVLVNMCKE